MISAAIKFVQGATVGTPGISLIGVTGSSVTYSNGDNNNVANWTWEWIDVPPASSILLGVISDGAAPSGSFVPDVRGGYLLHLVAKDITGKQIAEDYRVFQVLEASGRLMPPAQATNTMLNFANQKRGWAKYAEEWLRGQFTIVEGIKPVTGPVTYVLGTDDSVVLADTSGGAVTVTLPASPVLGRRVTIKDSSGNAAANNITIAGNGKNIDGAASLVLNTNRASATIVYGGTEWSIV